MVAEKFQIYGVKITSKYICESEKLNMFIFTHITKQNSPSGFYHYPPDRKKLSIPLWISILSPEETGRGRIM